MVPRRRVAGPPPPPWYAPPPPSHASRSSKQSYVIRALANGGEREHMEPQDREPQGRGDDHHLRHHHRHKHHYHWLWSSGQVGTVSHPKVQTLSNRTPDAQPAIAMERGAADRNHSGEGQGGTHTTGNHRGRGDTMGGGGGLAARHHIYIYM